MVFDGINVANSGALVRVVAKAPMDDTYSDFVVQPQRGCDYETTNVGVHPRKGGSTPTEGMGERGAREMHSSCMRGAIEMQGSFKGRCRGDVIAFS